MATAMETIATDTSLYNKYSENSLHGADTVFSLQQTIQKTYGLYKT
jgi:hypothetical protein